MKEPAWLTRAVVEIMHVDQVREHGGKPGVRDAGLLDSALARPRNLWEYDRTADLPALASEYAFGVARNPPFVDGNKRIAFVAANVFLLLNGFAIEAGELEVVDVMLRLADGRMSRPQFAEWIREHLESYSE